MTLMPPLLTPPQAAAILSLHVGTLARLRVEGGGPPFRKIAGRVRYLEADIAKFVEEAKRVSTSQGAE